MSDTPRTDEKRQVAKALAWNEACIWEWAEQLERELEAARAPIKSLGEWVPVSERLPENAEHVLIATSLWEDAHDAIRVARGWMNLSMQCNHEDEDHEVMYWMAKPKKPTAPLERDGVYAVALHSDGTSTDLNAAFPPNERNCSECASKQAFIDAAFVAHPNLDMDVEHARASHSEEGSK